MSANLIAQQKAIRKKDYVQRSHKRCKQYEIELDRVYSSKIIEHEQLFQKIDEKRDLIVTAAPFMNQLYNFVKGSKIFLILTDEQGCILSVIGNEEILSETFSFKMIPGAYMSEKYIGTNAMGTCIAEKKPVQISGNEHYVKVYHRWTCSAAPIKSAQGEIIGSLDITGYSENVHLHTLGMVVAASNAIEKTLEIKHYMQELSQEKAYNEAILDSITEGILTTDLQGNILTINKYAAKMFGYEIEVIKKKHITQLIKNWDTIKDGTIINDRIIDQDVEVFANKNKLQFNLNTYSILNHQERPQNIIYVFREIIKSRKTLDRINRGQAIYIFDKIIGEAPNFLRTIQFAKKISDSKSNVLIMGESGTGKELFAHAIHNYSKRKKEHFVALNCAAIPRNLIESELFGYEEGSFTGAKSNGHPGKFEIADGGTIFLDEIGDMPLDMQTRLLRVIEEGTISRIGSVKEKAVDVRVIAATNKNLRQEVEKGNFRKDLFYRLYVLPIIIPPLRERKSDIPLLIEYFMKKISQKLNKRRVWISKDHLNRLMEYPWPGNIRELENYIELVINNESISELMMPGRERLSNETKIETNDNQEYVNLSLQEVEKNHIIKVLKHCQGNITNSARILGIARNTLYRKMKEYQISCYEI